MTEKGSYPLGYVKSSYKDLRELYDTDPIFQKQYNTFEKFVDWMTKLKAQYEKCEYLLAKANKN